MRVQSCHFATCNDGGDGITTMLTVLATDGRVIVLGLTDLDLTELHAGAHTQRILGGAL